MPTLQSRHMPRILVTLIACSILAAGCGSDGDADTGSDRGGSSARESAAETAAANGTERQRAGEEEGTAEDGGGQGGPAAGGENEPADDTAAKPRRGPRLVLRDSQFGPVLFDGRNRALYLFTRDPRNQTRCYGACAAAWPPFYAKGRPRAGDGVDRSLLGTIKRRDGRRQVTYKGQALYFYVDDPRGQVLCNDVVEFGGTWYAVDAKGNPPA
jgi:predicted lipoprotein with Yx(FWY)xxD motif